MRAAVRGGLPSPCRMLVCRFAGDVSLDPMVTAVRARSLHWKVTNFPFGDCANTLFPLERLQACLWLFPATTVAVMFTR